MKARCITFVPPGRVHLTETEIPNPGPGELMIETAFSGISPGTELRCLAGFQVGAPSGQFIPGYSLAGRVMAVGRGTSIPIGSAVFSSGTCRSSLPVLWGAHCSHVVCPERSTVQLPGGMDLAAAALAKLAAISAHGASLAPVLSRDQILVLGLGPIGLSAALLHQLSGAKVLGLDIKPSRVAYAQSCGIDAARIEKSIPETIAGSGLTNIATVIDTTGVPALLNDSLAALSVPNWGDEPIPQRRLVVQGSYAGSMTLDYDQAFRRQVNIIFPRDMQREDLEQVIQLARMEQFPLHKLAPEPALRPEDAAAAYRRLADDPDAPPAMVIRWAP